MRKQPILTNYVSDIDRFLQTFDQRHPTPSLSQQQEITKYERIYALRDDPDYLDNHPSLWEGF